MKENNISSIDSKINIGKKNNKIAKIISDMCKPEQKKEEQKQKENPKLFDKNKLLFLNKPEKKEEKPEIKIKK